MKKNILFVDTVAYKPYDFSTLEKEPLGGSEASLLRVAKYLVEQGHNVTVYQECRKRRARDGGALFAHSDTTFDYPDIVVHMRTAEMLPALSKEFNRAKHYIWHHDLGSAQLKDELEIYIGLKPNCIFVSDYHRHQWIDFIKGYTDKIELESSRTIYNPVCVDGVEVINPEDFNPYKLVFLSSPHKGLKQTLTVLDMLRERDKRFMLHLFNPGYLDCVGQSHPGIVYHGPLPQKEMLEKSKDALCLFTCNHIFPETFGLVHAEMASLGVPPIAHDFGATRELFGKEYTTDTRNHIAVIDKIIKWSLGERPRIEYRPKNDWKKEWDKII